MTLRTLKTLLTLSAFALVLSACGEKPQTVEARKSDTKASDGASGPYVASGWTPGDAASWEEQMRKRVQGQNEYSRAAAQ
jgi:hypothetical protein